MRTTRLDPSPTVSTDAATESDALVSPSNAVEPLLRRQVDRWLGTPHVMGGTTSEGMDCSAFVQRIFADALQMHLPRTTEDQVEVGRRVNRSELRAGDLVFFQPPTKTNHVGIYLSNGEFAHVSSSAGVMISPLDLEYWRTSYWTSRRVLADAPAMAVREEVEDESPPVREDPAPVPARTETPPIRRVGW